MCSPYWDCLPQRWQTSPVPIRTAWWCSLGSPEKQNQWERVRVRLTDWLLNSFILRNWLTWLSVNSVTQSRLTLCNPMNCSMPGFHHQLLGLDQTPVLWVSDAIQPSQPLLSLSLPAFSLSQHQGLFQWVSSSHQVAKLLELQHQSFQWIFRVDFILG